MDTVNKKSEQTRQMLTVILAAVVIFAAAALVIVLIYFNISLDRVYTFSVEPEELVLSEEETGTIEPVFTVIDETLLYRAVLKAGRAKVSYKTADDRVVTVDKDGRVFPQGKGKTEITASWGGMKTVVPVSVVRGVDSLSFDASEIEVQVGEKTKLPLSYAPQTDEAFRAIRFSLSDESLASVQDDGTVLPYAVGDTVLTASCGSLSKSCVLHIVSHAEEMTLNAAELELERGDTFEFQVLLRPEDHTDKGEITWTSSDDNIVRVSENGFIMAAGAGSCEITASFNDLSASCTVHVSVPVESLSALYPVVYAEPGNVYYIPLYYLPEESTEKQKTSWESSDETVCSVYEVTNITENGDPVRLLCAEVNGRGVSVVTGKNGDAVCTCTVTSGTQVTDLKLSGEAVTIEAGDAIVLTAKFEPEEEGADKEVYWVSSNPAVASVSSSGVVTGQSSGEAVVTAVYSGLHASCVITVEGEKEAEDTDPYAGRILIGDSRMVYLSRFVTLDPGDIVIAKGAQYFTWFRDSAVKALRAILNVNPNYEVIINMGINDCANNVAGWSEYFAEDYVELVRELKADYPETKFYYASVGHCSGKYDGKIEKEYVNAMADLFNRVIKSASDIKYIDLCEYLEESGYSMLDGVHYDQVTSQKIYDYFKIKAPVN